MQDYTQSFKRLYEIVGRLRAPDGCPWDREQTPASLRDDLLEEAYECVEAINENDRNHIKEELGDIYLLATMMAYMHEEQGLFSVADVLNEVSDKLIRRHPHVFGNLKVSDSAEVLDHWARIKVEQEGRKPKDSAMDEVPYSLPPLERSYRMQKKASKLGFDWAHTHNVIEKIEEELSEVRDAIEIHNTDSSDSAKENVEAELGDLLFSVINLCRFLKVDPSLALQRTNVKFVKRFKYVEKMMKEHNQQMVQENIDIMDTYWEEAKLKT